MERNSSGFLDVVLLLTWLKNSPEINCNHEESSAEARKKQETRNCHMTQICDAKEQSCSLETKFKVKEPEYQGHFLTPFFHCRITISILSRFFSFFMLVKSILQVSAHSGPQFCLPTYDRLIFGSWFLKMISFWFMNYQTVRITCSVLLTKKQK